MAKQLYFLKLSFLILIAFFCVKGFAQDESNGLVEVESSGVVVSSDKSSYNLYPYKYRRKKWGELYSVNYSFYKPRYFQSDYANPAQFSFEDVYGDPAMPLIELTYSYKWNFILGALCAEMSYGMYTNNADETIAGDAQLELQMIKVGAKYIMDNIFLEPIIAPYVFGGAYMLLYDETQAAASLNGTTQAAPYWGAGVMLQLNKLEKRAAVDGYVENGTENTYIFAQARQFMESAAEKDPDFSTDIDFDVGLALEF
jgi:hypothetical protein